MTTPQDLSLLVKRSQEGDPDANERMVSLVEKELHALASRMMRDERAEHTLQPTALVNEACLRLFNQRGQWDGREHFLAIAATLMRRVLADHARGRNADKRRGGRARVSLSGLEGMGASDAPDLTALDAALVKLSELNERQGRIIEMRFMAGMTVTEVSKVLDVSVSTVEAEWRMARAWLHRELGEGAA